MVTIWILYVSGEQPVSLMWLGLDGHECTNPERVRALMDSPDYWNTHDKNIVNAQRAYDYEVRRWEVTQEQARALYEESDANSSLDTLYEWSCAVQKHARAFYRGTSGEGGTVVARRGNIRREPGCYAFGSAPEESPGLEEEAAYQAWKAEVMRYPVEEIREYEKTHPPQPAVVPQATPYLPGTRVRIITEKRPEIDIGVVLGGEGKWDAAATGGCLVFHDDGATYGWAWHEMVSLDQEQQAERSE